MSNIIELKDVWKTYQMGEVEVNALRGVNLTIKKGEFISIMGPSGSGKSTMVNSVGCLDFPTKGTIYLDNYDITRLTESQLAQIRGKKIGFIFQQFNLIPTLTAKENVSLPMMFQGVPKEKRELKAMELLTKMGLKDRMDHKPTELSGGQQQRVAIARSLANDPELILADEPTGNLDTNTGKLILEMLKDLHKDHKKTIVMVTHDDYLARLADRTVYLKDGQILKDTAK